MLPKFIILRSDVYYVSIVESLFFRFLIRVMHPDMSADIVTIRPTGVMTCNVMMTE